MENKTYKDLNVWQVAMELVVETYRLTRMWPDAERYGLISQAQRSSVSVPANIAEGYGRGHTAEYLHHLFMARGSLLELETHLEVAKRLTYVTPETLTNAQTLLARVGMMLNKLIQALKAKV
jgi:four helix bundle protein